MKWVRWGWLLLLVPVALGLARLRFDAEILDLLPAGVPAVQGLKIYQQHFTNARELLITVQAPDADAAKGAAQAIADALRVHDGLVSQVIWQPPWLEHPSQTAELIAYLWLNQPPAELAHMAGRLAVTNLPGVLAATRDQLATTLSPADLAQLSYDPYGFTRLPAGLTGAMAGAGQGDSIFASPDGTFRVSFARAQGKLNGYRECSAWLTAVQNVVQAAVPSDGGIKIGYTGRPAFVAEISASMRRDIIQSTGGTAVAIGILFWLAHRRWKPMLWLLTLLALILVCTLAIGGLIFGSVSVVSMGFAAILRGLAVDDAVVHYQEAMAQPLHSIPRIRRAIAPAIFWAAVTTISAFLVLNFGGLPGLAQLGSLVAIGVGLSAVMMIFAYLPPLFPERMGREPTPPGVPANEPVQAVAAQASLRWQVVVFGVTVGLLLVCAGTLLSGFPHMDATADALRPRDSQAYATLDAVQAHLTTGRDPLWLVVAGSNEQQVVRRLDAIQPVLEAAVTNRLLTGFVSPRPFWPRPDWQLANRAVITNLIAEHNALHAAADAAGFTESSLGLTDGILATWRNAVAGTGTFWPTNPLSAWIFEKLSVRETNQFLAAAFLFPATNAPSFASLEAQLPREGVWLSSWELLGGTVLAVVEKNLWKLLLPMAALILCSLWLAFRRPNEVALSLAVLLLSGGCLLAVMKTVGWSWNLLNLMALPLILGTGVDYSIFMQLALRRYAGDLIRAHRSVGRALLLCGGTAIAGFGSLGFSSNAGMASLGRVCAVGIAGNMIFSIFLLPVWWKRFAETAAVEAESELEQFRRETRPPSAERWPRNQPSPQGEGAPTRVGWTPQLKSPPDAASGGSLSPGERARVRAGNPSDSIIPAKSLSESSTPGSFQAGSKVPGPPAYYRAHASGNWACGWSAGCRSRFALRSQKSAREFSGGWRRIAAKSSGKISRRCSAAMRPPPPGSRANYSPNLRSSFLICGGTKAGNPPRIGMWTGKAGRFLSRPGSGGAACCSSPRIWVIGNWAARS